MAGKRSTSTGDGTAGRARSDVGWGGEQHCGSSTALLVVMPTRAKVAGLRGEPAVTLIGGRTALRAVIQGIFATAGSTARMQRTDPAEVDRSGGVIVVHPPVV